LRQLRKGKKNRPLNPKTVSLLRMFVFGPSKRQKKRVCRDPTPSDTPSDSDIDPAVPFADDPMEEDE
jgi:hypothetical protein